jgi:hypothetical protein
MLEMTGGATDAGYANRGGKAAVVESFGLAGFGYHARDEYIDTGSIVPLALSDDAVADRAWEEIKGEGSKPNDTDPATDR